MYLPTFVSSEFVFSGGGELGLVFTRFRFGFTGDPTIEGGGGGGDGTVAVGRRSAGGAGTRIGYQLGGKGGGSDDSDRQRWRIRRRREGGWCRQRERRR